MRKCLLLAPLMCLLLIAVACAQGNLLINPDILADADGAIGWSPDAWDPTLSTLDISLTGGVDESACLHIVNHEPNDARFTQRLPVKPDTVYRLSCLVRAQGVTGGAVGANISVENAYSYGTAVFDTAGEWVLCQLYGKTGPEQAELNVYVRLGGYSQVTVGEAWFDDICVEECLTLPQGVEPQPLYREQIETPSTPEEEPAPSAWPWVLFALLFCGLAAFAVGYVSLSPRAGKTAGVPEGGRVWLLLCVALLVRLVLGLCMRGFAVDIGCFLSWSSTVYAVGPRAFYASVSFCDYPPGYLYILWLCGALRSLLGQTDGGLWAVLLCKLPNILADVVACKLLVDLLRDRLGMRTALAIGLLYAINPAVVLDSAGWGQADGLLSLAIVIPLCLCVRKRWMGCLVSFALAVLCKPQALLFAPLGVLVLGVELYRNPREGRKIALGLICAVAAWLLAALPFALEGRSEWLPQAPGLFQPVLWLIEKYFGTLSSYPYYSVSACNLWDLIGRNWVEIQPGPFTAVVSLLPYAAAFGFAGFCYARSTNRGHIFLIAATMLSVIFSFGLKMHERYLFPALLLLCFAYGTTQDIRICIALVALSCAQFLNMGLVLSYDWTTLAPRPLVLAVDVVVIGSTALLVWTCIDICLRQKVRALTRIYRPSRRRLRMQEDEARLAVRSGLFTPNDYRMHLHGKERVYLLIVTALYAVFAFVNLGTLSAPQTSWVSAEAGDQVVFDLGQVDQEYTITYYGGICDSTFTLSFSDDGAAFSEPSLAQYDQGEIFRWLLFSPMERTEDGSLRSLSSEFPSFTARYVRLTAEEPGLTLSEVGFLSPEGTPLPVRAVTGPANSDAAALCDEQDTVPPRPSYYNSSYFDEIYHVRTAYEHIHGMHTYEWTHPPLGKLLIALGILLFKMCPFGWRFMGALSGVLMIPVLYLLIRQMTKSRLAALVGMLFLALDCMHFTQSRLGTIDCFAVLFILCMYLCMFRYCAMRLHDYPLRQTFVPLLLCGLLFALGCATKWICIYAGAGLCVLFFGTMVVRYQEYCHARAGMRAFAPDEKRIAQRVVRDFWRKAIGTCLLCVGAFILLPALVYYFSYYWQLTPDGNFSVRSVIDLQKSIFSYHSGLGGDTHFFRSPWYEWPLIIKPMWYYSGAEFLPHETVSSISCMGNPVVWWGGLAALLYTAAACIRRKTRTKEKVLLLVGFLSQYLPWVLVPRSTFIYHYFASVPFIIACTALWIADVEKRDQNTARVIALYACVAAAILCAGFYPLMSGTPVPREYAMLLRWFHWYNF